MNISKNLNKKVKKNSEDIKNIKKKITQFKGRPSVKIGKFEVRIKNSFKKPNFKNKTVLTDSTWTYVKIFLRKNNEENALFYWEQAENFFRATKSLSIFSAPLTAYYSILNASKALLVQKNVGFDLKHGVTGKKNDGHFTLQNELVKLKPKGILSSLCLYFEQPINNPEEVYSLKDIFYNLPFIHRAFTLTYKNLPELFIPIINPRFVFDKQRKKGWFEFQLERKYSNRSNLKKLIGYSLDRKYDNSEIYVLRRNKTFFWDSPRNSPTQVSLNSLERYYKKIRMDLGYIYGTHELWYIKRKDINNNIIKKNSLILTFASMHRLSEMARYNPNLLIKHLKRNASWLITEFINKALLQFIDNISSEITGDDFRITGFRQ